MFGNIAQFPQLLINVLRNVVAGLHFNGLHLLIHLNFVQILIDEEIDGEELIGLSEEEST